MRICKAWLCRACNKIFGINGQNIRTIFLKGQFHMEYNQHLDSYSIHGMKVQASKWLNSSVCVQSTIAYELQCRLQRKLLYGKFHHNYRRSCIKASVVRLMYLLCLKA